MVKDNRINDFRAEQNSLKSLKTCNDCRSVLIISTKTRALIRKGIYFFGNTKTHNEECIHVENNVNFYTHLIDFLKMKSTSCLMTVNEVLQK